MKNVWTGTGFAAVVLTVAIRLWFLSVFSESPMYKPHPGAHDRALYQEAAQAVAHGDVWPDGSLEYLPLYPWVLGAAYTVFGDKPFVPAILGMICDALTAWFIVLLARRLGARWWLALLSAGLYALYPLGVIYSALTMPNTLNTMLLTAWTWSMTQLDFRRPLRGIGPGLLGGLTALGFAGVLMIMTLLLVWQAVRGLCAHALPWRGLTLFVLAFAAPLVPVAVHNTQAEGAFVLLTTHGGFNFYMGNHERATGYPVRVRDFRMTAKAMLDDAHRAAEQEESRSLSRAESSAWWAAQGRAFWRAQPRRAIGLTVKKVALFWNHREVDDLRMREQLQLTDRLFTGWGWPGFALFGLLGCVGLVFADKAGIPKIVLIAGMVSVAVFFVTARYRLTLIPVMAALGAAGLSAAWPLTRTRIRRASWLIPAVAIMAYPFQVRDLRAFDYYNASVQVLGVTHAEQALHLARQGLRIDPFNADLHHAKGSALANLEQFEEAALAFQNTVQLNPSHATARYNLALCLARLGHVRDAIAVLEDWVRAVPHDQRAARLYEDLRRLE